MPFTATGNSGTYGRIADRDLRQRNELTAIGWHFSVYSGRDINRNADECAALVLRTYLGLGGGGAAKTAA
jgi:hypothetical protein